MSGCFFLIIHLLLDILNAVYSHCNCKQVLGSKMAIFADTVAFFQLANCAGKCFFLYPL